MGRDCKVYIGNLPQNIREQDVDDLFAKYGKIRYIDVKTPSRPPAYAFVEYDDPRDAEDAVRGRDGYEYSGQRLRVEVAKGERGGDRGGGDRGGYGGDRGGYGGDRGGYGGDRGGGYGGDRGGDRGGYGGDRGGGGGDRSRPPLPRYDPHLNRSKGTGFRVMVKNLPRSASWQDLKDFFRAVVAPSYVNVFLDDREGVIGIADFENADDVAYAIRKLDDAEFKNPFDKTFVRLVDDSLERAGGGGGGGGGRGRSPARRSRSRSPRRGGSRSPPGAAAPARSRSPADRSPPRRGSASPREASPRRD